MSIYDKKYQYMLCPTANEEKFYEFKEQIEKLIPSIVYKKTLEDVDGSILLEYEKEGKEFVLINDYQLGDITLYADINLNEYIKPYLERYKVEYEIVKDIRLWVDSYVDHCLYDCKEREYIKTYLDGSTRFEYYYEPNRSLLKKEFSFNGNIFKIRYFDDKGNITKVEKTEHYKFDYESLNCLHLPFDFCALSYISCGKDFMSKDFEIRCQEMEKENEEEKRYFEGLKK